MERARFGVGLFWLLFVVLSPPSSASESGVIHLECANDNLFITTWNGIANLDPAIDWLMHGMARRSRVMIGPARTDPGGRSSGANFSHCFVEYPYAAGRPTAGYGRVLTDVQWNSAAGPQQEGLKIEFKVDANWKVSSLTSIAWCASVESCDRLGLSFRSRAPGTYVPPIVGRD